MEDSAKVSWVRLTNEGEKQTIQKLVVFPPKGCLNSHELKSNNVSQTLLQNWTIWRRYTAAPPGPQCRAHMCPTFHTCTGPNSELPTESLHWNHFAFLCKPTVGLSTEKPKVKTVVSSVWANPLTACSLWPSMGMGWGDRVTWEVRLTCLGCI